MKWGLYKINIQNLISDDLNKKILRILSRFKTLIFHNFNQKLFKLATTNRAGRRLVPYRLLRLRFRDIFFGIIGGGGVVVIGKLMTEALRVHHAVANDSTKKGIRTSLREI